MQYIVEGSNGVPGIKHMRYSVTKGAVGPVLNLIVQTDTSFDWTHVLLLGEIENGLYHIQFLKDYQSGNGVAQLQTYNPNTNKRNELRAQIPLRGVEITALPKISIRDTHIKVNSWDIVDCCDGPVGPPELSILLYFGKGLIEVKKAPEIQKTETNIESILLFDAASFTNKPEALAVLRELAGSGIILRAA